jgi:Tautomerase enzyme
MPIVTIQITREGTTPEQKAALIKGATDLLACVLNSHKALKVKRQYCPRPRGAAFSLMPFSPGSRQRWRGQCLGGPALLSAAGRGIRCRGDGHGEAAFSRGGQAGAGRGRLSSTCAVFRAVLAARMRS